MRRTLRARVWVPVICIFVGTFGQGLVPAASARVAAGSVVAAAAAQAARIEGRVSGPDRRPVQTVRVSLLNDGYSPISSTYTDGSGRFRFTVGGGQYYVEVEPGALPYERERQRIDVQLNPFNRSGPERAGTVETFYVNIDLRPEKPRTSQPKGPGGVVFVQKIPDPARLEYERGVKLLGTNPDEAYASLRKALTIFPDYYDAMETLGSAYVKADYVDYAVPILAHAIEINPSGEMSHYALGVASYKQTKYADAVKSFKRALELNAKSVNAMVFLGLSLTKEKNFAEAEPMLKRAYQAGAKGVPELHMALASIYIDGKRNREAADQLGLLLKESPDLRDKDKIRTVMENLRKKPAQ